jgi:isopentenyl-diphosphate delta-isomerase
VVELLDLVDAEDQVIGTVERTRAHADPTLRHREVAILLTDASGRVLMTRRALTKAVNPGRWAASAAGHVDAGELPLLAARREMEEELGQHCLLEFVGKVLVEEPWESYYAYCYLGEASEEIVVDPAETSEWDFYAPAVVRRLQDWSSPSDQVIVFLLEQATN